MLHRIESRRGFFRWAFGAGASIYAGLPGASAPVEAAPKSPHSLIEMAMVFDQANPNGKIIHPDKPVDEPRPVASMAKLGVLRLVLQKIKNEKLDIEKTVVEVSPRAARESIRLKGFKLRAGDKLKLRELLLLMHGRSTNGAAVALAGYAAGSEAKAVEKMNERAQEKAKGYPSFKFKNSSGHPSTAPGVKHDDTMAKPSDVIRLFRDIEMNCLEQLQQIAGIREFYVPDVDKKRIKFTSLIKYYDPAQPDIVVESKTGSDRHGHGMVALVRLDKDTSYYFFLQKEKNGLSLSAEVAKLIKKTLEDRKVNLAEPRFAGLKAHLDKCIEVGKHRVVKRQVKKAKSQKDKKKRVKVKPKAKSDLNTKDALPKTNTPPKAATPQPKASPAPKAAPPPANQPVRPPPKGGKPGDFLFNPAKK